MDFFLTLLKPCFQPTYLPTYLLSQENGNKLGPASPQAFLFFGGSLANSFFSENENKNMEVL
jgi:hypothetical protein